MNKVKVVLNYNNIANNYLKLREKTKQEQYCIPVIKSDGYGFGSLEVVETLLKLQKPQKKYFVFSLSEAVDIRKYFNDKVDNIYVLDGIHSAFEAELFLKYKLIPVISSIQQLNFWKEKSIFYDKELSMVLKFNTGMNRSGNSVSDILVLKNEINKLNGKLKIEMIMSHFACAENSEHPIIKQQVKNFEMISKEFSNIKRCFCASDAIFTLSKYNFESTRPGYFLYGLSGEILFPKTNFKQVIENISATVLKDNGEYYINMGLEDGLLSSFNNKAHVLVDGKEIYYKEIKKDKIILTSNTNIEGKTALLSGFDDKHNKNVFMFNFFNTVDQEFCSRLLPSLKNKSEKFDLQIIGNFDNIKKYKKCIDNSFLNASKTVFKNGKLYHLETRVLEIIKSQEDGWIGYGATREIKKNDYFANIFNGYSDIFPRGLSNKNCHLFIENIDKKLVKCEIYGRISMDQISVKIPAGEEDKIIPNCRVLLFDRENNIDCIAEFIEKSSLKKEEIEYSIKNNKRTNFIEL